MKTLREIKMNTLGETYRMALKAWPEAVKTLAYSVYTITFPVTGLMIWSGVYAYRQARALAKAVSHD